MVETFFLDNYSVQFTLLSSFNAGALCLARYSLWALNALSGPVVEKEAKGTRLLVAIGNDSYRNYTVH